MRQMSCVIVGRQPFGIELFHRHELDLVPLPPRCRSMQDRSFRHMLIVSALGEVSDSDRLDDVDVVHHPKKFVCNFLTATGNHELTENIPKRSEWAEEFCLRHLDHVPCVPVRLVPNDGDVVLTFYVVEHRSNRPANLVSFCSSCPVDPNKMCHRRPVVSVPLDWDCIVLQTAATIV